MGNATDNPTIPLRRSFFPRWTNLDAYIFEEIHYPFLLAMLVFNGVFFIQTFGEISELSGGRFEIPFDLLLVIFLSEIPEMLLLTVALSFLTAALIALGRMSSDSEAIAPQAVGISFWRMNRPVLVYAAILSMLMFFLMNWGAPRLKQLASQRTRLFFDNEALPTIQPRVITQLGSDSVLFVESMAPDDPGLMSNLMMIKRGDEGREVILADRAAVYTNRYLALFGFTNILLPDDPTEGPSLYQTKSWEQPFPIPKDFSREQLDIERHELLNTPQLYRFISSLREPDPILGFTLWYRLVNPFFPFALALFAVPMAVRHSRMRRGSGIGFAILLVGFYFGFAKMGKDAVEEGGLAPLIGVGGPLAVYLVVGMVLKIGKNLWWSRHFESKGYLKRAVRVVILPVYRFLTRKRRRTPEILQEGRAATSTFVFPSKLDMHTLRSFLSIYLLVQLSFIMLYLLAEYIQVSDPIRRFDPESEVVLGYFLYKIPEIVDATLFICLLTAVLILLTIMSRNHEVTAVLAAGGSLHRLCLPLVLVGITVTGTSYYAQNTFLPQMVRMSAVYKDKIRKRNRRIFNERDDWLRAVSGEIVNYGAFTDEGRLLGVTWYRNDSETGALEVYSARELSFSEGAWHVLGPGRSWRFTPDEEGKLVPIRLDVDDGAAVDLRLDLEDLNLRKHKPAEFTIAQLRVYLQDLRGYGLQEDRYRTELYLKFAQPLVPLIMMILGMPLGFNVGRRGTFWGIGAGLIAGMAFLGLLELFRKLGQTGVLNPITAAWSVIVMFGAVALYRFINLE